MHDENSLVESWLTSLTSQITSQAIVTASLQKGSYRECSLTMRNEAQVEDMGSGR